MPSRAAVPSIPLRPSLSSTITAEMTGRTGASAFCTLCSTGSNAPHSSKGDVCSKPRPSRLVPEPVRLSFKPDRSSKVQQDGESSCGGVPSRPPSCACTLGRLGPKLQLHGVVAKVSRGTARMHLGERDSPSRVGFFEPTLIIQYAFLRKPRPPGLFFCYHKQAFSPIIAPGSAERVVGRSPWLVS